MQHQKRRRPTCCHQGNAEMRHQPSYETASILHELNLGQHTLFMLSNGSIDLLAHHEQPPAFAATGMRLDSDETYRLFISLHEQFKQGRET
jgi:hypothetical protein